MLQKTIFLPSGEKAGSAPRVGLRETLVWLKPSEFMT